jgi:hypothetical protein
MIKAFTFSMLVFFCQFSFAETLLNKVCYSQSGPKVNSKPVKLTLYAYTDKDLQKEVGALAEYNDSKNYINLVLDVNGPSKEDRESYERGDQSQLVESVRYEIIKSQITGVYSFVISGHGNQHGEYVSYKNLKSNKKTSFQKFDCE